MYFADIYFLCVLYHDYGNDMLQNAKSIFLHTLLNFHRRHGY